MQQGVTQQGFCVGKWHVGEETVRVLYSCKHDAKLDENGEMNRLNFWNEGQQRGESESDLSEPFLVLIMPPLRRRAFSCTWRIVLLS